MSTRSSSLCVPSLRLKKFLIAELELVSGIRHRPELGNFTLLAHLRDKRRHPGRQHQNYRGQQTAPRETARSTPARNQILNTAVTGDTGDTAVIAVTGDTSVTAVTGDTEDSAHIPYLH